MVYEHSQMCGDGVKVEGTLTQNLNVDAIAHCF